jgi:hypothetical protein
MRVIDFINSSDRSARERGYRSITYLRANVYKRCLYDQWVA